ncbi:lipocalin family protein [Seonamhaeicola sediminis]|uniref:Lipocalin family protein n=1 Tax=Seonamhaeicola sediminis TaxID=2528206 RepID=A0A562YFZ9_9FLAO|nr:lipocalin family protein [Seonamhaeicola sediminis]TWO33273.1 lipocalin family protein [Seonamhaeicola sediminis]
MKKLFVKSFIVLMILCLGCSSNNDVNEEKKDTLSEQFIGEWKPVKFVFSCTSGDEVVISSACEQTGRLTVSSNGTWVENSFYEYNNVCEDDGASNDTWAINGNELTVTVIENGSGNNIEITFFEISGNTLKIGQYDNELCDDTDASSLYYMEYVRI